MELPSLHTPLLGLPSRSRSLLLGVAVGLFISAAFTSRFAAKIVPNPLAHAWIPPSFISSQFYILFCRSLSTSPEDVYVSAVADDFPETKARKPSFSVLDKDDRTLTSSPEGSSSPSDHAEAMMDDFLAADTPELAFRLQDEEGWPNYKSGRPSAPAEASAARENHSLPVDSPVLIKDFRDRKTSTRDVSSMSAQAQGKLSSPAPNSSKRSSGRCDLSVGRWVHDDSYPLYQPGSCPFVDEGFSCQQNGRPDAEFSTWSWRPRDCTIPRFNGTDMLERLRGKRLVFVGDSLNRNQWESMLCILRESLPDKNRIVEIHGARISKLPGAYVFKFLDYDCRVEFYTSHFLVEEEEGTSGQTNFTVRLDRIDRSERRWRKANVLVFNTGHWWTPDKIGEEDNTFREGAKVYRRLDIMVAYRKAIRTWATWIDKYVDPANTRVFFRGYSPLHYIGGQWNSGGQCHNETQPIVNESFLTPYPDNMQVVDKIITHMRVPVHILNVTRLSDFRKDAHPAIYGHRPQEIKDYQDCSHWCLPGLPDTWNELLYFALFVES